MRIIIDTNTLTSDPRFEKAASKAIQNACKDSHCTVHLPEVVLEEFRSQRKEQIEKKIEQSKRGIGDLGRDPSMNELIGEIQDLERNLETVLVSALKNEDKRIDDWLREIKGSVLLADGKHYSSAMKSYFDGAKPFSERRSRKDIPDAIIYETIKDFTKKFNDTSYVITSDERLAKALEDIPKIKVYSSLKDFVEGDEFKRHLTEIENEQKFLAALPQFKEYVNANLTNLTNRLMSKISTNAANEKVTASHDEIDPEIMIEWEPEIEKLEFDIDQGQYYGGGIFSTYFTAETCVECSFPIPMSNTYNLDEDDEIHLEPLNDHYMTAHRKFALEIRGEFNLAVDRFVDDITIPVGELLDDVELEEINIADN